MKKLLVFLSAAFLAVTVNNTAFADIGPKPSVKIIATFEGSTISDPEFDETKNCYWSPAETVIGADCKNSTCEFTYLLPSEFKLAIYLPYQDKLFVSDIITRQNFRSTFNADLKTDGTMILTENTTFTESDMRIL